MNKNKGQFPSSALYVVEGKSDSLFIGIGFLLLAVFLFGSFFVK